MSDEKQLTEKEALDQVLADVKAAASYIAARPLVPADLPSEPSIQSTGKDFLAGPDDAPAFREPSDVELEDEIDRILNNPEIDAMLEGVAEGVAQDLAESIGNVGGDTPAPPVEVTRVEFEAFQKRVAAAFKHAGFKF